jgi:hypothetical protein
MPALKKDEGQGPEAGKRRFFKKIVAIRPVFATVPRPLKAAQGLAMSAQ